MDCFFQEGIKVFYRVGLAVLILFQKSISSGNNSEWSNETVKEDIDNALTRFCKSMPVSPTKLLRTAFNIRALRWVMGTLTCAFYNGSSLLN